MLKSFDSDKEFLQQIVNCLTIHTSNKLLAGEETDSEIGYETKIEVNGYNLTLRAFISPGEYFLDKTGEWKYIRQFEIMDLRIEIPKEIIGKKIIRDYGTYSLTLVDGKYKWTRIDRYSDFLGIDQTHIQVIKSLYK